MRNIAFTDLTQAMTVLIAEHMHFLFLILKKSEMKRMEKEMKMTVIECKKEIEKRKKKLLNEKITAQEKAQLKQEIAYFYKRLWVN